MLVANGDKLAFGGGWLFFSCMLVLKLEKAFDASPGNELLRRLGWRFGESGGVFDPAFNILTRWAPAVVRLPEDLISSFNVRKSSVSFIAWVNISNFLTLSSLLVHAEAWFDASAGGVDDRHGAEGSKCHN